MRRVLDVVGHSVSEYHSSDIGIIRFALCRLHFFVSSSSSGALPVTEMHTPDMFAHPKQLLVHVMNGQEIRNLPGSFK